MAKWYNYIMMKRQIDNKKQISMPMGAIVGSIAEAYYGVPDGWKEIAKGYFPAELWSIVEGIVLI